MILKKVLKRYPIRIKNKNKIVDLKKYSVLKFKYLGENIEVEEDFTILNPNNIIIQNNVFIGKQAYIDAKGGLTIKEGTMIGPRVFIMTSNHDYDSCDLESIPYGKANILKPVTINENVWIGSNVTIVPGITIGEGAVIAMGSVVTKDVEPMSVVGGNPAKILKYRNEKKYFELKGKEKIYYKIYKNK